MRRRGIVPCPRVRSSWWPPWPPCYAAPAHTSRDRRTVGLQLDLLPGAIRIELLDRASQRLGLRTQILLVDDAVLIHQERHHTGHAVFGGERHHREASDQMAVGQVIVRSAGSI